MILVIQIVTLVALLMALLLWLWHFPYPSPLLRPFLPGRSRWPEKQVRSWLKSGRFHPGFLAYFTRDPDRDIPAGKSVLAPADGLVTSQEVRDGIRYVVVALSFWDVHVQRSPLAGKVVAIEELGDSFTDGEGRNFLFLNEKKCPVQKRIVLETEIGIIAVRLITSIAARRIEVWPAIGQRVDRGERIGSILLGSTVVLELPASMKINQAHRERVWAGETVIAYPETETP